MHMIAKPSADSRSKISAATWSLWVSLILFVAKFWAYKMTSSQAVYSDALESIVNIVAAILALWVIRWAARPADKGHPYGHGKAELLSSAFEGGLIAFAGLMILIKAIEAFIDGNQLQNLDYGIVIVFAAGIVNMIFGRYLRRRGKALSSPALEASGEHLISDFWTSIAVVGSLIVVRFTGLMWLDTVVAAVVSLHLLRTGYHIVRTAIAGLMDEEDGEFVQKWRELINYHSQPGIIQIHHLRLMRSGSFHHVDAHVVVPEFWNVKDAHDNTLKYEKYVFSKYPFEGEIHFHLDPCRQLYCKYCDLESCPVRKEEFQHKRLLSVEELTDQDEPGDVTKK